MRSMAMCFLGLLAMVVAYPEQYSDKYDSLNIDEVLSNKRLIESYLKCVLYKGPCTQEGIEIQGNIKEAVQNYCKKCTPKRMELYWRLYLIIIRDYPDYWNEIMDVFDPESKYMEGWLKRIQTA